MDGAAVNRARSGRLAGIVAALAVLAGAGEARSAILEWEATLTLLRSDFSLSTPPGQITATSHGLAVVNGSAGAAGLPLDTLSIAVSEAEHATSYDNWLPSHQARAGFHAMRMGSGVFRGFSQGVLTRAGLPIYAATQGGWGLLVLDVSFPSYPGGYSAGFVFRGTTNGGRTGFGLGGASIVQQAAVVNILYHIPHVIGFVNASLLGAPWTIGRASLESGTSNGVAVRSVSGFVHGPVSATTVSALTGAVIQLVTPLQIRRRPWIQTYQFLPVRSMGWFGVLDIQLVPEPSRGLGMLAGALALLLLGVRRRRSREPPSVASPPPAPAPSATEGTGPARPRRLTSE
jgi:hypothetical protein